MRYRTRLSVAGAVLLTAAWATACGGSKPPEETPPAAAAQPAGHVPSDEAITTSIQAKYFTNDHLRGQSIDVTSEAGTVSLSGTVPDADAKQEAVNVAKGVEGVVRVGDQLTVAAAQPQQTAAATRPAAPGQPTGTAGREADSAVDAAWITTKIRAQYFVSPEVKPWNVDVSTGRNGVVTLRGEVEKAADKTEALRIARETEGVARVEDHLRIKGERDPSAPEPGAAGSSTPGALLTAKIQAKYFLDSEVKGRNINVDSQDGRVTLTGTVGNDAERRQAVALARATDGVTNVIDSLEVRADAAARSPGVQPVRTLEQTAKDTWLTTTIQSKYFLDSQIKGHEINVDTRKGVVTLKGSVTSDALKTEAERIARETEGVSKVINQLDIKAG